VNGPSYQADSRIVSNAEIHLSDFCKILFALIAIATTVQSLEIEQGMDLPRLLWITLVGFSIYAFSPLKLRLPIFFLVNVVALVVLFDPISAAATLALGLLLVVMATLPIKVRYRVALVLSVGTYLALGRAEIIGDYILYQVSGILGGLFMFRAILYLYEMQYETTYVSIWTRVSYFFLLPNLIFQLFPIVDYKTFIRSHYSKPAAETYRKGLHWIALGVLHLLIYRAIYHYLIPLQEDIDGILKLSQYIIFSYALIIRLSGIFHLCAGIICLFGFDLPKTFDNYFLAHSFSDLWKRINTYWRTFVMRVIYTPIYFRLKHHGRTGIFIAVLLTFAANFVLHTYQWFWVRGHVQVTQTDVVFWGVLGLLLAFNSILPVKRVSLAKKTEYSHRNAVVKTLKILGVFSAMALLWSLWISGTVNNWLHLLERGIITDTHQIAIFILFIICVIGFSQLVQFRQGRRKAGPQKKLQSALASPVFCIFFFLTLSLAATDYAYPVLKGIGIASVEKMRSESLNIHDQRQRSQGYYDSLIAPNNITSKVWERQSHVDSAQRRKEKSRMRNELTGLSAKEARSLRLARVRGGDWNSIKNADLTQSYDNSIRERLKPNLDFIVKGVRTSTNAHGMKDRPYALQKPPATYRFALLGGSPELGMGVPIDQTMDNILEDHLSESPEWSRYKSVEILNFAAGKYTLMEHVAVTENLIEAFSPDAIMLYLHYVDESDRMIASVAKNMIDGRAKEYPYLADLAESLNINGGTDLYTAVNRLKPFKDELYFWALERIARFCDEKEIELVIMYMGVLIYEPDASRRSKAKIMPYLTTHDFNVIDLYDVYDGQDKAALMIAPWDDHPNAKGHALLADAIFREMKKNKSWFLKTDSQN
jgi:hypothetical protein